MHRHGEMLMDQRTAAPSDRTPRASPNRSDVTDREHAAHLDSMDTPSHRISPASFRILPLNN